MLNKMMEKLLAKKRAGGDELDDAEKNAKMHVINAMRDMASSAMGEKLQGLKKVSVASDSDEGLAHGLDKAKEILSHKEHEDMVDHAEGHGKAADDEFSGEEMDGDDESEQPHHEAAEGEDDHEYAPDNAEHASPDEELDEDEINKRLEHLMKLKDKKKQK